ncbi:MAG TPA: sigma-70 family RNA polymerase sigma factor [Armatimonadota bacterium]
MHDDFERLVSQNYERIYGVIWRLVGDCQEAEDLTQDTFVNAYRARDGFRGDSHVYTWLYRIAVNLTKNRLEQLTRRRAELLLPGDDGEEAWLASPEDADSLPERQVENSELGEVVAQAVLQLPAKYREVVILREYEQLSYEDVAEVLGYSVPTIKSRLFRARGMLRRRLARYVEL